MKAAGLDLVTRTIVEETADYFGISCAELLAGGPKGKGSVKGKAHRARRLALFLVHENSWDSLHAVAGPFGLDTTGAKAAIDAVRKGILDDRFFASGVRTLRWLCARRLAGGRANRKD